MKYTILINQRSIIDNGWKKIKFNHCAVLDVIANICCSKKIEILNDETGNWAWVSPVLIINELPLSDFGERWCKNLINDLCEVGLLEKHKNNRENKKMYLRLGANFLLYNKDVFNSALCSVLHSTMNYTSQLTMNCTSQYNNTKDNTTNNNFEKFSELILSDTDILEEYFDIELSEEINELIKHYKLLKKDISYKKFKEHFLNIVKKKKQAKSDFGQSVAIDL